MSYSSRAILAFPAGLMLIFAGCGGAMPAHITGIVTLDGAPLTSGTVAFHPVGSGVTAVASIDENGSYQVRTGHHDGLPLGEYRITVTAVSAPPAPKMTAAEIAALFITPRKYADPSTTDLTLQVAPGTTQHDIKLTSK